MSSENEITELSHLAYQCDLHAEQATVRGNHTAAAWHAGRASAFRRSINVLRREHS